MSVALAHDGRGPARCRRACRAPTPTARGWVAPAERASRLVVPDDAPVDAVVAARCDVLLAGPPTSDEDPVGFLLGVAELVRMGELAGADVAA